MKKILSWLKNALGFVLIDELKDKIQPCPICGGPAKLIEIEYVRYEGEPQRPSCYTVECADFDDHGLWCTPGKCYFHGHDSYRGSDLKTFMSPWSAVKHWNEVVVPIGISAKQAMERLIRANEKEKLK
jgi:hypothetical protein